MTAEPKMPSMPEDMVLNLIDRFYSEDLSMQEFSQFLTDARDKQWASRVAELERKIEGYQADQREGIEIEEKQQARIGKLERENETLQIRGQEFAHALGVARSLIGILVGELRAHRYCGDQYPENGWPSVNAVLSRYAAFKRGVAIDAVRGKEGGV